MTDYYGVVIYEEHAIIHYTACLLIKVRIGNVFSLFLSKTFVVDTQKNRLNETHV